VQEGRREAEELRQELARLDAQLIATLHRRARTSKALGHLRGDHGPSLVATDNASIRAVVEQARQQGGTADMPEEALRDIFREIYAACTALELPAKVAFVGPEGGGGYAAARGRFGRGPSLFSVESTAAALQEVTRKRAQLAVVPFETSTEGPVQGTLLALLASDLRIVEIVDTTFHLHLMNRSGSLDGVQTVYATPADHARCQRFLSELGPHSRVIDVANPHAACQHALEEPGAAALANEAFGGELGLEIARRNVLDAGERRVRYAVVGTRPTGRTGSDMTSLVFGAQDDPGSLLDVLRVFAERGVNLTNIHSHPAEAEAWRYLFYVEMAGHFTDRPLVAAFEEMKRMTRFFKVLGSYPAP
jgi:chorismate mutase/prephenate dehydratase